MFQSLSLASRSLKLFMWLWYHVILAESYWPLITIVTCILVWIIVTPFPKCIVRLRQQLVWSLLGCTLFLIALIVALGQLCTIVDSLDIPSQSLEVVKFNHVVSQFSREPLLAVILIVQGCILVIYLLRCTFSWTSNKKVGGCSGNLYHSENLLYPSVANLSSVDSLIGIQNCNKLISELRDQVMSQFKDLTIEIRSQAVQLLTLEEKLLDISRQLESETSTIIKNQMKDSPSVRSISSLVNQVSPQDFSSLSTESVVASSEVNSFPTASMDEPVVNPVQVVPSTIQGSLKKESKRNKKVKFAQKISSPTIKPKDQPKIEIETESSSESEDSDSDDQNSCCVTDVDVVPQVHPVLIAQKKPKKKSSSRTPLPESARELFPVTETMEELREQVQKFADDIKELKKQNQKLTEDEARLSKGALERRWSEERHENRYGPRSEDQLTNEEKAMTRRQLKEKFSAENRARWVQRQLAQGVKLKRCESCGRYEKEGDQHVCMRAPWSGPLERRQGVPYHREMVMTGGSTGVSVRQTPAIDLERLTKEHDNIMKMKAKLQEQEELIQKLRSQSTDATGTTMPDIVNVNRFIHSESSEASQQSFQKASSSSHPS